MPLPPIYLCPITLHVTTIPMSEEDLFEETNKIQIIQNRINTTTKYLVKGIHSSTCTDTTDTYYTVEQGSDTERKLDICDNVLLNQELDEMLQAFDSFKNNDFNASELLKCISIDFYNGVHGLLLCSFTKDETNDVDIWLNYGWYIDDRRRVSMPNVNLCYNYITKRFHHTLNNFCNAAPLKGLTVQMLPHDHTEKILSSTRFDEGILAGDPSLYALYITKSKQI